MPLYNLLNLDLQFFAADDGGGNGSNDDSGSDDLDSTDQTPPNDDNNDDNSNDDDSQDDKTFDASYVKDLRRESAARRTENKQLKEQMSAIQKALGLEGDEPDADELKQQLQSTQQQLQTLKIENAFGRVAEKLGADADLTLAVLKANGELNKLDPENRNFKKHLENLVKETLEDNPKLKATQPQRTGATPPSDQSGGAQQDMNTMIRRIAGR